MIFTPASRWNHTAGPPASPDPPSSAPESRPASEPTDDGPVPPHAPHAASATQTRNRRTLLSPPPLPSPMDTVRQAADAPARTQARGVARHAPSVRWPMLPSGVDVKLEDAPVDAGPGPLLG